MIHRLSNFLILNSTRTLELGLDIHKGERRRFIFFLGLFISMDYEEFIFELMDAEPAVLGGAVIDAGGNLVEDVARFEVDIDTSAPVVARVYEEGGMLKIVTVRDSECSYSLDDCDFSFSEGTEMPYGNTTIHVAEWSESQTYYVKCRDEFLNEQASCSIVVRPTENFL